MPIQFFGESPLVNSIPKDSIQKSVATPLTITSGTSELAFKLTSVPCGTTVPPAVVVPPPTYNLIDGDYECIIRSRYDLGTPTPYTLENLDLTKLNISAMHWPGSPITDDNLCITSQPVADRLFSNIFDEFIYNAKKTGKITFQEKNFMEILNRKDLYKYVCKTNELPFQLLRENKLWF